MQSNVFYCQLLPSQPSHRNIVLYNLTDRTLTFYKTITRKYIAHQLHALTLLISRQQALLQYHGVSLLNNDVFTVTSNTKCITISTQYIASVNLQEWQQQLATQLTRCDQIIDFNSTVRRLVGLLMREVRYLIPTYKNVLINNNSQIDLNMSSTIGWKLLIFEEQIPVAQFRQMCMFIDRDIFERSPLQRINYRVQQRSLCIILLSLVAQQLFNLPNKLKLPQLIDVSTAKVLLLQIDTKIHKFLQVKQIRDRIKQKSQESGIDLLLLFESILIPTSPNIKRSVMWSDILQVLMPLKSINQNLSLVLSHIAHQQWAQLTTIEQQTHPKHGLFQLKHSEEQWNHYEVQILLLHILRQKLEKGYIFDRIMRAKESSVMTHQGFTLSHKLQQLIISQSNKQVGMPQLHDSNMKTNRDNALPTQDNQVSNRIHNCMLLAKWCQSHQISQLVTRENQLNTPKHDHRLTALKMYHQL